MIWFCYLYAQLISGLLFSSFPLSLCFSYTASFNSPGSLLPHDLCTCCFYAPNALYPDNTGLMHSFPSVLSSQVSVKPFVGVLSRISFSHAYFLSCLCFLFFLALFFFLVTTYHYLPYIIYYFFSLFKNIFN